MGKEEEVRKVEKGGGMWKLKERKVVESDVAQSIVKNQLSYNSIPEDCL